MFESVVVMYDKLSMCCMIYTSSPSGEHGKWLVETGF